MMHIQPMRSLWTLCISLSTLSALADGMVVPQVFYPKVEIPNQQALIHFSNGIERLVIETSFLGEGTNFAWIVPLPSAPEIKPVSEHFFDSLRQTFRAHLTHRVHPYYAGVVFLWGLAFLAWRSFKDEVGWPVDLPLCLVLALGAGLLGGHFVVGILAAGLSLYARLAIRSTAGVAWVMIVGVTFAALMVLGSRPKFFGLIQTLGSDAASATVEISGVSVVSVQHAGVFDATTIRGDKPGAVLEWFEKNGYQTPRSAEPAIRHYLEQGWVFVASRVRRQEAGFTTAPLHPLAFTFAAGAPVYPMRLTAINNRDCTIDLYVFGNGQAAARHFRAVRCDRVAGNGRPKHKAVSSELRISDPEVQALVGGSTVGTKLTASLNPKQMESDTEIKAHRFSRKGANVYSHSGALTIALNLTFSLTALSWLLIGASQGGWNVDRSWIWRWRRRLLTVAFAAGFAIFLFLPKVEVESVPLFSPTGEASLEVL